jgi:Glycosyltransferase family 87
MKAWTLQHNGKLLPAGLGLIGLLFNLAIVRATPSMSNVDFNEFYSAGKLAGSGHLYDWDRLRALEMEHGTVVPFGRIPVLAFAFKPLSELPWPVARALWLCINIVALTCFVYLLPCAHRGWVWVAMCWSLPAALCLVLGQDSILFLLFIGLGQRLLRGGRDFWAGVAFAGCIAKPHLALLLPILLLAQKNWKALLGGATGCSAAMMISFAGEGNDWPRHLWTLAHMAEFDPAAERMPNLRGLLSFVGGSVTAELALGLTTISIFWFVSRAKPGRTAWVLLLADGLLLSHHAYSYDAVLLLPALLLPFEARYPYWMRWWALLLLTPTAYHWLNTNTAIWIVILGQIAINGYVVCLMILTCMDSLQKSVLALREPGLHRTPSTLVKPV